MKVHEKLSKHSIKGQEKEKYAMTLHQPNKALVKEA